MKNLIIAFVCGALPVAAQTDNFYNFIRQHQQGTGVVWDMQVEAEGSSPSALAIESGGALFQLWSIDRAPVKEYLLDQKFVGAYLPKAEIKVVTLDPEGLIPRTRVDQPFTVEIDVSDLLIGAEYPLAASCVLLERHLATYQYGQPAPEPAQVLSGTPYSSGYIGANGKTVLRFPASALTAADPTKVSGEEHFVIHALSDGTAPQTQITSKYIQVWPVASGAIKGIAQGDKLRFQTPQLELLLNDLYPRSDTYLYLFEGTQYSGVEGKLVKAFPMDRESSESHVIRVTELDSKLGEDGTYTLALFSDTVYGRELLCEPVTFSVNRTIHVNAMLSDYSDDTQP